jgi:hypothetical protein
MLTCERCGSSFSPIRVRAAADCPRCRARDGVCIPLTLTLFETRSAGLASTVDRGIADPPATPFERLEQESE